MYLRVFWKGIMILSFIFVAVMEITLVYVVISWLIGVLDGVNRYMNDTLFYYISMVTLGAMSYYVAEHIIVTGDELEEGGTLVWKKSLKKQKRH